MKKCLAEFFGTFALVFARATALGAVWAVSLCSLIRGRDCCGRYAKAFVIDRRVSDRTGILRS